MKMEFLGNKEYGGWNTVTTLDKNSVVYSFGVGYDIAWELALIERFGCTVYAFDPSPNSILWLKTQTVPREFIFTPVGIGTYDGMQKFFNPFKEWKANVSTIKRTDSFRHLPVRTLQSLMKQFGHERIDLLKMDIEGGEFAVIPAIARLPISQMLVEIHTSFYRYGLKGLRRVIGWMKEKRIFSALAMNGFTCVCHRNQDYTFYKEHA